VSWFRSAFHLCTPCTHLTYHTIPHPPNNTRTHIIARRAELATIVHDPAAHHTPTPSQLEVWDASRRQDITDQIARLEHRKAEDRATATATSTTTTTTTATATPATIQQKRAEREARRRQLAETAAAAEADADTEGTGAIGGGSEVRRHGDAPAPAPATTSNAIYTISVPTTSDTLAWYDSASNDNPEPERHRYTYETIDAAREAHVWNYPSNAEERARCEVFRDLWEKGYYMGGGSKFGGDWLVYPGACALLPFLSCIFFTVSSHVCVCIHACAPPRPQAIRCVIIRTLLPLCKPPHLPRCVRWKSWRMVDLVQRRKRRIFCVAGTLRAEKSRISASSGQDSVSVGF
jgi:tRNA splicing endonuclease